jgi:hypothetical protein
LRLITIFPLFEHRKRSPEPSVRENGNYENKLGDNATNESARERGREISHGKISRFALNAPTSKPKESKIMVIIT